MSFTGSAYGLCKLCSQHGLTCSAVGITGVTDLHDRVHTRAARHTSKLQRALCSIAPVASEALVLRTLPPPLPRGDRWCQGKPLLRSHGVERARHTHTHTCLANYGDNKSQTTAQAHTRNIPRQTNASCVCSRVDVSVVFRLGVAHRIARNTQLTTATALNQSSSEKLKMWTRGRRTTCAASM